MHVQGLAGFLRPGTPAFPREEPTSQGIRTRPLPEARPKASGLLLQSFAFLGRRVPPVTDLSGPLAAFRLAEAGRFLTGRFQSSGLPLVDAPASSDRLSRLQTDSLDKIRDRLQTLRDTVDRLRGEDAFNLRRGESSRPDLFTVEAGPGSPESRFRVRPRRLASGEVLASSIQPEGALGLSGRFRISGVAVTVAATDDLAAIRDRINQGEDVDGNGRLDPAEDLNQNGTADVLSVPGNEFGGGFFQIEDRNANGTLDPSEDLNGNGRLDGGRSQTGVDASVSGGRLILSRPAGASGGIDLMDEGGLLQTLGFFTLNSKGQPVLNETQLDFSSRPATNLNRTALDAEIELDGERRQSAVNRFEDVFPETDLVVQQASDREALARVFLDAEGALNQIQSLFDAFNAAISEFNGVLADRGAFAHDFELQSVRRALIENPQARVEEKAEKADNRKTLNPQAADNGAIGIRSVQTAKTGVPETAVTAGADALRRGLQPPSAAAGNELFQRLSSIGIRTREDDTFVIDRRELEQALLREPETVLALLNDPEDGLLPGLERQLDSLLRDGLGRLDLKRESLRPGPDLEAVEGERFRAEQENRVLGLGFRNLIAVI